MHDSSQARQSDWIKQILGDLFALTDPGYTGLDFCVAGFKPV